MKLAEALARRADIQTRISELQGRIAQNARHQEGEDPPETPATLLEEVRRLADELEGLIRRINRTNSQTVVGRATLTDAIARRDALLVKRRVITAAAEAAAGRRDRVTRSEVKYVTSLDVAALRREADDLAQEYRTLDVRLQEANWTTDLVDEEASR